jgi:hypothetical protein
MTRLRSLIKEVLSQPKKKDCGCGCNDCGGKAPILTEGKFKPLISEGLQHHIDKKISLFESVYRIGSEKHLELIREARALWIRGIIEVSDDDKGLLETHLGHFGLYEGVEVPLDLPMVNEEVDEEGFSDKIIISIIKPKEVSRLSKVLNSNNIPFKTEKLGKVTMFKFKEYDDIDKVEALISRNRIDIDESLNENNLLRQTNLSSEEYQKAKKLKGFNADDYTFSSDNNLYVKKSSLKEVDRYSGFIRNPEDPDSEKFEPTGAVAQFKENLKALFGKFKGDLKNPEFIKGVAEIMVNWKSLLRSQLDEAKKKKKKEKKDPPLNKPKRGGSKAYYVYVRDPKTKKIKKVSFGSGGLRAKIKNKEARNAFAARHNCKNKKDRTKAGYWSCNLPRYADQLGLGSKMNTFW